MNKITKWNFKDELQKLAISCTNNKPSTAKQKANKLFNKYEGIMSHTENDILSLQKQLSRTRKINTAITTGKINWDRGYLKLSQIESVDTHSNGEQIIVITKTGQEIAFSYESYNWLLEL